jgi:hypothetical protein
MTLHPIEPGPDNPGLDEHADGLSLSAERPGS